MLQALTIPETFRSPGFQLVAVWPLKFGCCPENC